MKKILALLLCAMLTLSLFGCGKKNNEPLDSGTVYYADIVIKDHGTITVKLDQSAAPITVENFVNLANQGFYDGLTFHRIINFISISFF